MSLDGAGTTLDYPDPLRIPLSPTSTESANSPAHRPQSTQSHPEHLEGTASLFSAYGSPRNASIHPATIPQSDDSWSQISVSPALPPAGDDRGEAQSPQASTPPRNSLQAAASSSRNPIDDQLSRQEARGMHTIVTRSQSDFSQWLESVVTHARGDGTSTIGSDDASYQNLMEMTRQARESIGFGPSESSASEHPESIGRQVELGSAFELRESEDEYYAERDGDRSMAFDQSENFDDLVLVSSEEKEAESTKEVDDQMKEDDGEGHAEEADLSVFIEPEERSGIIEQFSPVKRQFTTGSVLRQSIKFVATLLLQAGTLYLAITFDVVPGIQSFLSSTAIVEQPYSTPHNDSIAIPLEEEFIPGPPTSLATPLSVDSVAQVAAFFGLLVLGRFVMSYGRSKSTAQDLKSKRSPSPTPSHPTPSTSNYEEIVASGIRAYTVANLSTALASFDLATTLFSPNTSSNRKAITFEWVGRTLYRLERYEEALVAFKRSIRFNSKNVSARASAARTYFRMGEYVKAETTFRNAGMAEMKAGPSFAWEFMGKSLVAQGKVRQAEDVLRKGLVLDRSSYRLLAYLGELLHALPATKAEGGGNTEAKKLLEESLALRLDQPVLHLRLAFINNQSLDSAKACQHLSQAIKFRESGFIDTTSTYSLQLAENNLQGFSPYLYHYFSTPTRQADSLEKRLTILGRAKELYETDLLVRTLWATGMRRSANRASRDAGGKELRVIERELAELDEGDNFGLGIKGHRWTPHDAKSIEEQGLTSLVLSGLGRQKEADDIYDSFWRNLQQFTDSLPPAAKSTTPVSHRDSTTLEKGPPDFTFLIMAFYEAKGAKTLSRVR